MVSSRKTVAAGILLSCLLTGCVQNPRTTTPSTFPQTEPAESSSPTEPVQIPETSVPLLPETTAPSEAMYFEQEDFVRVLDHVPNVRQELRYATADNFTGQVIYEFKDAYLRYGTVCKLADAAGELEEMGLGIMIWDAFRPVYAQERLFEVFPDPTYVSKPGTGKQNHSRGLAVDLTLYDLKTGVPLQMPSAFDDFSLLADREYSDVPKEAAANAALLETVMERHGFRGYRGEWWHYNDSDEYPIEEAFDPANT